MDIDEAIALAREEEAREQERIELENQAKRAKLRASVKYSAKTFDPFNTLDISAPVESSPEPATDGQISFLAKLRVDATSMSKRQASKLIGAHKRRSK